MTKSLLRRDFNLTITLPDDRLCPPVPVRYNYVYWLQRLLDTTSANFADKYDPDRTVLGLDIGTGASAIYPLIACSLRPRWTMYATDIDSHSLGYAEQNIERNGLDSRIRLRRSTLDAPLLPLDSLGVEGLDMVMCNPPFYASRDEMTASQADKVRPPSAVCTGADVEMICQGGDAGFVLRMVEESLRLRTRVQWYSSMLGKLGSLHVVISRLKEVGVTNWAVTSLRAGKKTRRWAVAWSFGPYRPSNDVARGAEVAQQVLMPFPTIQTIKVDGLNTEKAAEKVNDIVAPLRLRWHWQQDTYTGVGVAKENVWSRSARRKWKRAHETDHDGDDHHSAQGGQQTKKADDVVLAFRISVTNDGEIHVRWLQGHDSVIFESFCGMLQRAMREVG